jgi:hypothetical protein
MPPLVFAEKDSGHGRVERGGEQGMQETSFEAANVPMAHLGPPGQSAAVGTKTPQKQQGDGSSQSLAHSLRASCDAAANPSPKPDDRQMGADNEAAAARKSEGISSPSCKPPAAPAYDHQHAPGSEQVHPIVSGKLWFAIHREQPANPVSFAAAPSPLCF